jgi:cytochrome b561
MGPAVNLHQIYRDSAFEMQTYQLSRLLHWLSVGLVLVVSLTALFGGIDPHGSGNPAFLWHSSLGIVLYLLTMARALLWVVYRQALRSQGDAGALRHIPTPLRLAFYGLLIALPASGWFLASEQGMNSPLLGIPALPQWYHEGAAPAAHTDTSTIVMLHGVHAGLAAALFLVIVGHLVYGVRQWR